MAQFVPLNSGGGLPQSLAGGVIALGVDSFGISNNNKQTGEFLRVLIGDDFEEHKGLETMDAVANSRVAMDAVANSRVAMDAVANSSVAMEVVINSSVAMEAVVNSSVAMEAVVNSSVVMDAVVNSSVAMDVVVNSRVAMEAVINSRVAMEAVINSSVAMEAVVNSSVAMEAVVNSSVAMDAVANSSVAMEVVVNSRVARDAFVNNNTRFQAIRKTLYDMVRTNWVRKVRLSLDMVADANAGMAFPVGIVFANLGTWSDYDGGTRMIHYNGIIARDYTNDSIRPDHLQPTPSAVSFNGATFMETGDGYVYTELWAPK